jgi:hypothetical protein
MPENALTIADVYKPTSAMEYMQFAQAAMQNKIAQMQMDEYQRDLGLSASVANALMQVPAAPTPTAPQTPTLSPTPMASPGGALQPGAGTPSGGIQPGVTPAAPAMQPPPPAMQEQIAPLIKMAQGMGIPPEAVQRDPAGFYRWAQAQQTKQIEQIKTLGSFIKNVGLPAFKRMAEDGQLDAVFPMIKKMKLDNLSMDEGGKSVIHKLEDGSSIVSYTDDSGKEHVYHTQAKVQQPASARLKYIADEIKKQNPDMPDTVAYGQAAGIYAQEQEAINTRIARARAAAYSQFRPYPVVDKTNNEPKMVSGAEILNNPDKYASPGPVQTALNKKALLEDIRGSIVLVRGSVKNLSTPFSAKQIAALTFVSKQRDPKSALSQFFGSEVASTLSEDQWEYLVQLNVLVEQGMAMRSVLGAGQGSDMLREAIKNVIPTAATPSAKFVNVQLDAFEKTLDRLSRGILNVKLAPMPESPTATPPPAPATPGVTIMKFDAQGNRIQ